MPKHAHADYQFGLSFDCAGEYTYRREHHVIQVGSLSIIHSGEVHAPSDRAFLPEPAHFGMAHISPNWLQSIAAEIKEKPANLPFFPEVSISDPRLNRLYLALQAMVSQRASQLDQDMALWNFLVYLITNYASRRPEVQPITTFHRPIQTVCDYLQAHFADDVALAELAAIAGLSRFHFCRTFSRQVGLSPNIYQTQLRLGQARRLLAKQVSIADVAIATGFYDQSHFSRQFKRYVGVTPGNYMGQTAIFS
ncbi:MAG: AraC family transcriptional regulator [Cyanothece sp. SIO2G6]|nr:AraC family transcriptional regulator [Cyanothece sp. SIO2G6]